MSPRSPRVASDHARHDRLLVSRFAADDAFPTEVDDARTLVDSCADCAALAADIGLIRSATAGLPAPARPRDFRLTVEQAENLRGSAVERLLRRLAAPNLASLRPVAGAAMSLGLALAVVGAALPTPAAIGDENAAVFRIEQQAGEGEEVAPGAEAPAEVPAAGEPDGDGPGLAGTEDDGAIDNGASDAASNGATPPLRDLLIYAGLVLTMLSLAVLLVVSIARRRWLDPLLR